MKEDGRSTVQTNRFKSKISMHSIESEQSVDDSKMGNSRLTEMQTSVKLRKESQTAHQHASLITVHDDDGQSNNSYSKKVMTKPFRRKGINLKVVEKFMPAAINKLSKEDLVPPNKIHHSLPGIDLYLRNVFDFYAKQYGEYFQDQVSQFDEKLELAKREIQLISKEKNMQNSMNVTILTAVGTTSSEQKDEVYNKFDAEKRLEKEFEMKKFPSLAALKLMGVKNFKPSIKHQILSNPSIFKHQKEQNNGKKFSRIETPFLSKSRTIIESVLAKNVLKDIIGPGDTKISNFTS